MNIALLFAFLSGATALLAASCSAPEYRPTEGNTSFVIKKIDGKRRWGLVESSDTRHAYIPCRYDSIFSAHAAPYHAEEELFIAVEDGKMYAWYGGKQLLGGKGFTSFVSCKQDGAQLNNSSRWGGGIFHEARTDEGVMFFQKPVSGGWIEFGPAEALLWDNEVILSKKNGKWAVLRGPSSENYLSRITPYLYDSVISVGGVYFWVEKDGKWAAIDKNNRPIRKSVALLNKYRALPSLAFKPYMQAQRDSKTCKVSVQEASYICVSSNYSYMDW